MSAGPRKLVLLGGGHTHALVLHHWAAAPMADVALTLINPDPTAPYTGMLPGHIAGHYPRAALEIDLDRLAARAGATLIEGRATGLDPQAREIMVTGHGILPYDIASIDIGITSDLPNLPGYNTHAVSAKPLGAFARAWQDWCARLEAGRVTPDLAVIGGGVAGVELALAMAYRLRAHAPRLTVIEAETLLPDLGPLARARLRKHLQRAGVAILEGARAEAVTAQGVTLADGRMVPASLVLGAAGARPQDWLRETGLPLQDGFITVEPTLRVVGHPTLFAVGDCAHMAHAPRAKAGVYAVRQAPYLLDNLRATLTGQKLRPYQPQRDYLKLISLGGKRALADKWSLPLEGAWLWRLKDRIDARFMAQFRD